LVLLTTTTCTPFDLEDRGSTRTFLFQWISIWLWSVTLLKFSFWWAIWVTCKVWFIKFTGFTRCRINEFQNLIKSQTFPWIHIQLWEVQVEYIPLTPEYYILTLILTSEKRFTKYKNANWKYEIVTWKTWQI
jgi:hypothetical protein